MYSCSLEEWCSLVLSLMRGGIGLELILRVNLLMVMISWRSCSDYHCGTSQRLRWLEGMGCYC